MMSNQHYKKLLFVTMFIAGLSTSLFGQGVGISESSITPDGSAILELRSTTRGFLMPRNSATLGFSVQGLSFYNTTSNRLNFHNGSTWLEVPTKSDNLSVFAATTSLELSGVISDETGTGLAVFATNPTFTGFSSSGAAITMDVGSGNFTLDGAAGSVYSIGTSTTTGTISIGGSAQTGNITLGSSTAAQSVFIGNGVNTGAQIISIANGATAANSTVNILSGTGSAGAGTVNIGNNPRVTTIDIGNATPSAARTITIGGSASAVVDQINIGTGATTVAGGKTVNIATTAPTGSGTNLVTIGAASTVNGNGIRLANARVVTNRPTAPTTGGAVTLTAAQVLDAGIYVINANVTVTFPTAANLVAAMPNPQVGDCITFAIASNGNFTPTIAVGAGGTIGSQTTGVARVTRYLTIRITNVGAPAYTIY